MKDLEGIPDRTTDLCGAEKAPLPPTALADFPRIAVSHNRGGYDDISTVYAYYTAEQKAEHGKHCEHWTEFGHRPETRPYATGQETQFCLKVEAENPGKFSHYLISWSGCD